MHNAEFKSPTSAFYGNVHTPKFVLYPGRPKRAYVAESLEPDRFQEKFR